MENRSHVKVEIRLSVRGARFCPKVRVGVGVIAGQGGPWRRQPGKVEERRIYSEVSVGDTRFMRGAVVECFGISFPVRFLELFALCP